MSEIPLKKIAEGREAEMFEWGDGKILRLPRRGDALAAVERQARTLEQVAACGVRVPRVIERVTVNGRAGFVMERIVGVDLLTLIERRPWSVWWVGGLTGHLHAKMHGLDAPKEIEPLRERIVRMASQRDRVPERIAIWALRQIENLPDGVVLCHGDFNPANVMMDGDEPVVLDWTNVARGDPVADVARTVLILRVGEPPPGSGPVIRIAARFARRLLVDSYLRAYRRERDVDGRSLERWVTVRAIDRLAEGIPEERDNLLRLFRRAMRKDP